MQRAAAGTTADHAARLSDRRRAARWLGLIGGPLLALLVFNLLPDSFAGAGGEAVAFTSAGRATLAMMVWMSVWWLTEAIDISATALLPLAAFPLFGILPMTRAAAAYGSDLIFLFMGGFILALSMQRWGLDRRIALTTLRFVGTRPANVLGGFMVITAILSMWVSNTATAAMMLPIALSVVDLVLRQQGIHEEGESAMPSRAGAAGRNFALTIMLGIAYSASIGGVATIIGSPPNTFLVQFVRDSQNVEISFVQWMVIAAPVMILFLPIAWFVLQRIYPMDVGRIEGGRELIERELAMLGPMKRGEWVTMTIFFITAALWISRPLLVTVGMGSGEGVVRPFAGLTDSGIAILASMALFVIPVDARGMQFTMNWPTAARLPWGILILFGGGLSLAAAVQATGVAEFLGAQSAVLQGAPAIVLVLAVTAGVIFLTELTSNIATTAALVPILAALAAGLGVHPSLLIFPATIAASCAFMMPVGTPPNAIVFGSGHVSIPEMVRAGIWLNLLGIVLITALMYTVALPVLGIRP